jgi:hypothetical protein
MASRAESKRRVKSSSDGVCHSISGTESSGKRATSSSMEISSHVAGWRHGETSSRKKSVT